MLKIILSSAYSSFQICLVGCLVFTGRLLIRRYVFTIESFKPLKTNYFDFSYHKVSVLIMKL